MSNSNSLPGVEISPTGNDYLSRNFLEDDSPASYEHPQRATPVIPKRPTRSPPTKPGTPPESGRLVLAIDYGTTYTGIAFARTDSDRANLASIEVLKAWTSKMSNNEKVPSVKSYTKPIHDEAQWGSDISDNAVTMVNQKLELELQDSRIDELDLTLYVLRGTGLLSFEHIRKSGPNPDFTPKPPEDVVRDYLEHVCECAYNAVNGAMLAKTQSPIDIVITTPVCWSYQGCSAIFKAAKSAGFNNRRFTTLGDVILVSEPEAAAYFTARDMQGRGPEFLQENACFILCDAGGGTVDTVAYQVKKLKPHLELERATDPTGKKCGSALIDTAFKRWLREVLGKQHYAELDPANADSQKINAHTAESGPMRKLIKAFNAKKFVFSNDDTEPIKIDLPPPLDGLTIDGRVYQGELTITWDEMKELMDVSVDETVKLVLDQRDQVAMVQKRRIKNVFLVGGFGASPYLQQELNDSLGMLRIQLRRPESDKSLTAVVQGGVIYGIEKARFQNVTIMRATKRSYGVRGAAGRFEWLIKKGDLVMSTRGAIFQSREFWYNVKGNSGDKHTFGVYCYEEGGDFKDEDLPLDWETGQHEVSTVKSISLDLRQYCDSHPHALTPGSPGSPGSYGTPGSPGQGLSNRISTKIGPMRWHFEAKDSQLQAKLLLQDREIGACEIDLELVHSSSARRRSIDSTE